MGIIAIDVSKYTLDILQGQDPRTSVRFKISNSVDALEEYLASQKLIPQAWTVAVESTGDYHRTATLFFLRTGFTVKVLNPLLTKQFTNATIRKLKTDRSDAEKIMKLALAGEGDIVTLEALTNPAKELLRLSHFLTKLKTQLKLRLQSVEAKNLVADSDKLSMIELIERMQEIVDNLDQKALCEQDNAAKFIDSIPGFSAKLSQIVVTELGDITRFKDAKAIVAFAGLDPKTTQSGHSIHHNGKLTKRGSSFLRYALYLAARVAWRHDQELHQYYEKKRGEGRKFTEVMCMISRKLLHRIYRVVKEQRLYMSHQIS